jgi:transcriptional regulator with XRE-family HTH domain
VNKQNNKYLKSLGRNIREIRKNFNISQEELAARSEIDRSYVGGIERGERNVSILTLIKIALTLNCKLKDLTKEIPHD